MIDTEQVPIPATKDAKSMARDDGKGAFNAGLPLSDNPHSQPELKAAWTLGWANGKNQLTRLLKMIR